MNFLRKLLQFATKKKEGDNEPPSIVMLLREPHFFSASELEQAGERGFGKRFDGEEGPMYFVSQTGKITFLKAGKYVISLIQANEQYLESTPEVLKQLPQAEQREAWKQHHAWADFALMNKDIPKADSYVVLSKFVLQLGDANCCGIHFPGENIMMPNDGTAEQGLRMLIRKEFVFR